MATAQPALQPTVQRTIQRSIERIVDVVSDPDILGGMPVVNGTRIPAEIILVYLQSGADEAEIVGDYPSLPRGGIEAVRSWARANALL